MSHIFQTVLTFLLGLRYEWADTFDISTVGMSGELT